MRKMYVPVLTTEVGGGRERDGVGGGGGEGNKTPVWKDTQFKEAPGQRASTRED